MVTGFFDKHFPFLFRYHYQPDTIFLFWPLSPMSRLKDAHGQHNLVLGKRFELEFYFFIGPISSLTTEKCIILLPVINHQKVLICGFIHLQPCLSLSCSLFTLTCMYTGGAITPKTTKTFLWDLFEASQIPNQIVQIQHDRLCRTGKILGTLKDFDRLIFLSSVRNWCSYCQLI